MNTLKLGNFILGSGGVSKPKAPTGLSLTVLDDDRIKLDWTDNSTNEDGFKIERGLDGITFGTVIDVAAGTITYTNSGLDPNTKYYYRVRAYKGSVYSDYTSIQNATTLFPELVTSLVNGTTYPYETAVINGRNITSAINTSGGGAINDNVMSISGQVGDKFRLVVNINVASGQAPIAGIYGNREAVGLLSSNTVSLATGSYNTLLTISSAGTNRALVISNTLTSNWSADVSLRKEL